jgi:hypothetical protein
MTKFINILALKHHLFIKLHLFIISCQGGGDNIDNYFGTNNVN